MGLHYFKKTVKIQTVTATYMCLGKMVWNSCEI